MRRNTYIHKSIPNLQLPDPEGGSDPSPLLGRLIFPAKAKHRFVCRGCPGVSFIPSFYFYGGVITQEEIIYIMGLISRCGLPMYVLHRPILWMHEMSFALD